MTVDNLNNENGRYQGARMKPFSSEDSRLTQEEAEATAAFGVPLEQQEDRGFTRRLRRMSEVGGVREAVKSKKVFADLQTETDKLVQPVRRETSPAVSAPAVLTLPNLEQAVERGMTGPVVEVLSQYSNEA